MYSVLNTLSEYTYFYISRNITSYTLLFVFKIVESFQGILKIEDGVKKNYKVSRLMALLDIFPAGNYMFKVKNRNTRARSEICSKLTIKTLERGLALFWCLYC